MPEVSYLDNAASAPMRPEALEALLAHARDRCANPSAIHALGQEARKDLEAARAQVAALVGMDARDVVFTSGATEANNLAIRGVLEPLLDAGKPAHAVATALEHASVLKTYAHLEKRGLKLSIVPPSADGLVRAADVIAAVTSETALVSVIVASNELGTVQPVAEIAAGLKKSAAKTLLHVDAVQAVVGARVDMKALGADLLALSGHKIGGPKGVGSLVRRRGVTLSPIVFGGGHEEGLRSGTENAPGIVAFGAAAAVLAASLEAEIARYGALRARILDGLAAMRVRSLIPAETAAVPHILTLECPGTENDWIVLLLSRGGVMISAGSACKAGSREASPVLRALGLDEARARSVVRVSLGHATTDADVDRLLAALPEALAKRM